MIRLENMYLRLQGFDLKDVNLHVQRGECFALLGPTGSGKTLVLETVAGLLRPTSGKVFIDGEEVTALPPEDRNVGIMYQDHALFPHLSVTENIRFGLRYKKVPQGAIRQRMDWLVSLLGLERLLERRTEFLSGGEKQRVSLARALMVSPKVLLLDEPLSALDPVFREEVRRALKTLHKELRMTFLLVTHDFAEALYLTQRVGVIRQGRLEQVDTTEAVFQRPSTPFVAGFVGMKNIVAAHMEQGVCRFAGREFALPRRYHHIQGEGFAALRPEDARIITGNGPLPKGWGSLPGTVRSIENMGTHWQGRVVCPECEFLVSLDKRDIFERGVSENAGVRVGFSLDDLHILA